MYPNYNGTRPKMEIYHGTADTTLYPNNYRETMKEWANVFGYDYTKPDTTQQNTPQSGYTKQTWGNGKLVGILATGVGHTVPIRGSDDMTYFGL
jgi:acetylxylan esterase